MEEKNKFAVTIIMPALNEENNVLDALHCTLKTFQDFQINGEILVINDGSIDRTQELVEEAMKNDNRIRILRHEKPKGLGVSFWDGVDNAYGEAVVVLPGDNENIPWEILRYYELLEHVDIVIPFIFNKEARSLFRNIFSFIYRFIINSTFMVNFNYTNGTVLYRRSILKELDYRSEGFFFQTDILIRLAKQGYLFAEVPYRLNVRKGGSSTAVTFPSLRHVIRGYLTLLKDFHISRQITKKSSFITGSLTAARRHGKF